MNVPTMPLWTSGGVPPAYIDMTLAFQLALPALTRLIVTPGFALVKLGIAVFSSQWFSRGSLRTSQVSVPPAARPLGLAAAGAALAPWGAAVAAAGLVAAALPPAAAAVGAGFPLCGAAPPDAGAEPPLAGTVAAGVEAP